MPTRRNMISSMALALLVTTGQANVMPAVCGLTGGQASFFG